MRILNIITCESMSAKVSWRASVASKTLTGVTQLKIRDVCLFIYLDVHMSFCTLTLCIFVFAGVRPRPKLPKQNPLV